MTMKKIYSSDRTIVEKFAAECGKELVFLDCPATGYCESGNQILVFCKDSEVDLSENYHDVTWLYN